MCSLRLILLICFSLTAASVTDICFLVDAPMYCTCDASHPNEAHAVSCYIVSYLSPDDSTWTGFTKQRNIRQLTLSSRSDAKMAYVPTAVLRQLTSLVDVSIMHGLIETMWPYTFVNMTTLRTIKLVNNGIKTMEPFAISFMPNLLTVSLVNNQLERIHREAFYRLPSLKELFLERNSISAIDDFAFVGLFYLEQLELWDNQIHNISANTFVGLDNLRRLFLHHNQLKRLVDGVFSGAQQLRELDLRNNMIETISPHAFDGLNHLDVLMINNNFIVALPSLVFKGATRLTMIDITKNNLTAFSEAIIKPLYHSKNERFALFLRGNPLVCDCDLLWMSKHANASKSVILRKELRQLKCEMDDSTRLQRIVRLSRADLNCPDIPTEAPLKTKTTTNEPFTTETILEESLGTTSYLWSTTEGLPGNKVNSRVADFNGKSYLLEPKEEKPIYGRNATRFLPDFQAPVPKSSTNASSAFSQSLFIVFLMFSVVRVNCLVSSNFIFNVK